MKSDKIAQNRIVIALAMAAMMWMGPATAAAEDGDEEYEVWNVAPHRYAELTRTKGFFHVAPMVGATGLYGDLSVNGSTADLEFTPVDAAESLDLDVGLEVEVGHRHTSVLADMRYLHAVTDEFDVDNGQDGRLDLRHFVSHLALHRTYSPHRAVQVGPVGGVRIFYADARLADVNDSTVRSTQTWVEPVVGIRGRLELGEVVFIPYHADIGALGLGSRTTWQAYGALGLSVDHVDFELGYRHMHLDLDGARNVTYDLTATGPVLLARFRY